MNICEIENGVPCLNAAEQSHVNAFLGWISTTFVKMEVCGICYQGWGMGMGVRNGVAETKTWEDE